MQLSRFTDYSIRVLIYSAIHQDRLVTLTEMADFYDVSLAHLRKVVHNLAKSGLLNTQRGKHGGMKLAKPADSILMGQTIASLEGNTTLIDCSGLGCNILPACALPKALKEAQQAFYQTLDQYTLQDMVKPRHLRRVFGDDICFQAQ